MTSRKSWLWANSPTYKNPTKKYIFIGFLFQPHSTCTATQYVHSLLQRQWKSYWFKQLFCCVNHLWKTQRWHFLLKRSEPSVITGVQQKQCIFKVSRENAIWNNDEQMSNTNSHLEPSSVSIFFFFWSFLKCNVAGIKTAPLPRCGSVRQQLLSHFRSESFGRFTV